MAAPIIDSLVNDLSPRTPMRSWQGAAAVACATLAACVLLVGALGMRKDLMGGDVPGIFFIRQGILLLLGSATSVAVIGMAQPSVGRDGGGWRFDPFPCAAGRAVRHRGGGRGLAILPAADAASLAISAGHRAQAPAWGRAGTFRGARKFLPPGLSRAGADRVRT